jgi:acylpyruvate hydrolase
MRIGRVRAATGPVMVVVEGDDVFEARAGGREFDDLPDLLLAVEGDLTRIESGARFGAINQTEMLAPVARPRKIIGIGLNYRGHAAELGVPPPPAPPLFPKWDNAIAGPYDDITMPAASAMLDYESELAFIIGRRCRDVLAGDAASVLFGFTCANDLSARDLQNQTGQWSAGKIFDAACPLGPWIVTADELGPSPDLAIRGRLDGELVQDSRTSDLIYPVPELIAFLTRILTLEPGDVVLTGTPAGVGMGRVPPRYLRPGETYEVEIEGIGTLRNRFVAP